METTPLLFHKTLGENKKRRSSFKVSGVVICVFNLHHPEKDWKSLHEIARRRSRFVRNQRSSFRMVKLCAGSYNETCGVAHTYDMCVRYVCTVCDTY